MEVHAEASSLCVFQAFCLAMRMFPFGNLMVKGWSFS